MSQKKAKDALPDNPDDVSVTDLPGASNVDPPEDFQNEDIKKIQLNKDKENLDGATAMMRDPIAKTSAYKMKRFITVEEAIASDPNLMKLEERRSHHMTNAEKWKQKAVHYERRIPSLKRMLTMFRTAYALHDKANHNALCASELTYWIKRRIQDHKEQVANHNRRIENYNKVRSTPFR